MHADQIHLVEIHICDIIFCSSKCVAREKTCIWISVKKTKDLYAHVG